MTNIKHISLFEQIIKATNIGNKEQLSVLITQSKNIFSCNEYDEALRRASKIGHAECVKLLIPVSDPKANESYALKIASTFGHIECVKLLIPVSDPKADNSYASICPTLDLLFSPFFTSSQACPIRSIHRTHLVMISPLTE